MTTHKPINTFTKAELVALIDELSKAIYNGTPARQRKRASSYADYYVELGWLNGHRHYLMHIPAYDNRPEHVDFQYEWDSRIEDLDKSTLLDYVRYLTAHLAQLLGNDFVWQRCVYCQWWIRRRSHPAVCTWFDQATEHPETRHCPGFRPRKRKW